jgi:hypothetical protein
MVRAIVAFIGLAENADKCMLEKVAFAKMVNRGDALESDEWRHEPYVKLALQP